MKKIIFFIICAISSINLYSQSSLFNIYEATSFSDIQIKNYNTKATEGIKILTEHINLIYAIPFDFASFNIKDSIWGLTVNINGVILPYCYKLGLGCINYTGITGSFNQPNELNYSICIKPELPSFTASKKTESTFVQMTSQLPQAPDFIFFADIDRNIGISINWNFNKIGFGISAEKIIQPDYKTSTWYNINNVPINEKNLVSLSLPFYIRTDYLTTTTIIGNTINPYNPISIWCKNSTSLSLGIFKLKNQFFLSDSKAINANGTAILTPFSISVTPEASFKLKSSDLNLKLNYSLKHKITDLKDNQHTILNSATLNIKYTKKAITMQSESTISFIIPKKLNVLSQKIQLSYRSNYLNLTSTLNYKYTILAQNYIFAFDIYPKKKVIDSLTIKTDLEAKKQDKYTLSLSVPLSLKWKYDYINVYAKFGFFHTFYINSDD